MSVMSVGGGGTQERLTALHTRGRLQQQPCQGHCRGARKDKIVLSLGRVNIPIFAGYSLSVFVHFGLILINFPL